MEKFSVLDEIANLERECFADCWTRDSIAETLEKSHNLLVVAFTDENGNPFEEIIYGGEDFQKRFLDIFDKRSDVSTFEGYIIASCVGDESELFRIAVAPDIRRHKFGFRLIKKYLKETKADSFFLEVRIGNLPARSLYEKVGYEQIAVRKTYYKNPIEDAIIYEYLKPKL